MSNKAFRRTKINMNGKETYIETPIFGNDGHQNYSGYGYHNENPRKDRRAAKNEARMIQRSMRGDY